ncbi:MAG: CarD family transcriptional regulator [Finegoldia sp.]|nr:CarD family transcriptional regulator [Finegoldia sp.]
MMFELGDKVMYPVHGAGIIIDIEKKEILSEIKEYYIISMVAEDMKISVPKDKIDEMGIRFVDDKDHIQKVLDNFSKLDSKMPSNWNHRYKSNLEKLREGDIEDSATVFRNLYELDKEKGLSMVEKKVLNTSRKMLISEVAVGLDISREEAVEAVKKAMEEE